MATGEMRNVLRHLRQAVCLRAEAEMSDRQLLERFLGRREEAAFAALLHRHGPLVWGVCRRVLGNHHDAEDAFQATFLVLARKAGSIAARDLLANWLYGVAHRTALKARATAARRQARERQVADMPEVAGEDREPWQDLLPLLDRELSRLPEKYRAAIVLCDLEGKTRREAARQLGVPEGTVAGRLARARALLAKRLTRDGLALSGAFLAAALARATASAGGPPLASWTGKAAGLLAAGQGVIPGMTSAKVVSLAEGVLKAMGMSKVKAVLGGCLVAGVLLLGGAFGYRTLAADKTPAAPPGQKAPAADKPPVALCEEKLRDTLLVLDKQYWEATSSYDVDTLAKLLADDYIGFSPDGAHWTKPVTLDRYRQVRHINVEFPTGKTVVRLNEHAALLTYEILWGAENKGEGPREGRGHDRMISCWVQRDGGWFLRYTECINRYNFPDRRPAAKPPAPGRFDPSNFDPFKSISAPPSR